MTAAQQDPAIECRALTKKFGSLTALDQLNLRVEAGELFGFLGPNGAGKTTTIKLLTGLLRPTSGTAHICGICVQEHPLDAKRLIGYVPDSPFLYEKLTGWEFLSFVADLYSVPFAGRTAKIQTWLDRFELSEKRDELIQGYSRGMRQKLALAAALLHQPRVLFLDEPTVGLDPKSARMMKDVLRDVCREGGTVFVSTHILDVAERMCDRFGIINKGRLIATGTMEELRSRAATEASSLEDIFLELTTDSEVAET